MSLENDEKLNHYFTAEEFMSPLASHQLYEHKIFLISHLCLSPR